MYQSIWAIAPGHLENMQAELISSSKELIEARINAMVPLETNHQGDIAVIPLSGVIDLHDSFFLDFFGGTSIDRFKAAFAGAVADQSVGTIIISVDSPGGTVFGVQELSQFIFANREAKQIISVNNSQMASAALWIASAAHSIIAAPSSETGSIGVFAQHFDITKMREKDGVKSTLIFSGDHKVETHPDMSLSDSAKKFMQSRVGEFATQFVSDVARNRGIKASVVNETFGQGRMFGANQAISVGMIDSIDTLDGVIGKLISDKQGTPKVELRRAGAKLRMMK